MLDEIIATLTSGQATATNSVGNILFLVLSAIIIGLIISYTYQLTVSSDKRSESVSTTLLLMPAIVGIVVALIGNNIAGAFSLAGIFSIIRFRSAPSSAKDILYILFCAATGLACGVGAYGIGILVAIILCVILFVSAKLHFGHPSRNRMLLKILVPEDMNVEEVFGKVLKKYTVKYDLQKMRTKDLGSLFELTYSVDLLPDANKKKFLDDLRVLNGNLTINLDSYNLTYREF
jgi:hypothetical protein